MKELEEGTTLSLDFNKLAKAVTACPGIIPVAVQHADTREVILVAYTNEIALKKAIAERTAIFWSTSRNELWEKGKTSGETFELLELRVNCEQNSLVYIVRPRRGGICHTRNRQDQPRNCYYRALDFATGKLIQLDPVNTMTTHTPHPPHPVPKPADPVRAAANRRIFVFVTVFTLLLAGALWLVMREEKRRSLLIRPEAPALPVVETPAAKPVPVPTPVSAPAPPTSPALQQSEQMEIALAAFREAANHLVAKQFPEAEERALAALAAYPKMAAAQRILGLVYLQQGRMDRAIAVLEASLRNEPFHPEALTNLAFAYLQAQNPALAMELIETCRRLHPDYKPALLQQGIMLLTQPDSQEAVEVLQEAVDTFPNLPGPRNNLAVALARRGDREGAREQLAKLLEMDPGNFSALFNMGGLYAQETNAPAAIPWLRQAMERMPPANFRAYLNDPDLAPIRETEEFKQLLQEIDPAFPGQPPPSGL